MTWQKDILKTARHELTHLQIPQSSQWNCSFSTCKLIKRLSASSEKSKIRAIQQVQSTPSLKSKNKGQSTRNRSMTFKRYKIIRHCKFIQFSEALHHHRRICRCCRSILPFWRHSLCKLEQPSEGTTGNVKSREIKSGAYPNHPSTKK